MKTLLLLGFAAVFLASAAQATVNLECGSFMQDPISIQLNGGQAVISAPDILVGRVRTLDFKGDDGATALFAGDKNTVANGKALYSSLALKVPSKIATLPAGSKVDLALIETYSEKLSSPGVPFDWKPKCVVKSSAEK